VIAARLRALQRIGSPVEVRDGRQTDASLMSGAVA
jgi:hypothetical protein